MGIAQKTLNFFNLKQNAQSIFADYKERKKHAKSFGEELHEYLWKPDGKKNWVGRIVIGAFTARNIASIAILLYPSRVLEFIGDPQNWAYGGLGATTSTIGYMSLSSEKRQKLRNFANQYFARTKSLGRSYIHSRSGGVLAAFAIVSGKLAYDSAQNNDVSSAAEMFAVCAGTTVTSAFTLRCTWKMEKIPTLYSGSRGIFHGMIAIFGASYLMSTFNLNAPHQVAETTQSQMVEMNNTSMEPDIFDEANFNQDLNGP